jgi:hypothetical protein
MYRIKRISVKFRIKLTFIGYKLQRLLSINSFFLKQSAIFQHSHIANCKVGIDTSTSTLTNKHDLTH